MLVELGFEVGDEGNVLEQTLKHCLGALHKFLAVLPDFGKGHDLLVPGSLREAAEQKGVKLCR